MRILTYYAMLSIFVLPSCGSRTLLATDEEVFPPTFTAIRQRILIPRCGNCHAKLVSINALTSDLVVPGNPTESRLYKVVKSGDMPRYSPALKDPELKAIETWITNGAHND